MPRWKLTLEFDGSGFQGWQRQPEGRTVEGVVEDALSRFCGVEVDMTGQGRTDSGVHAEGQVAHADLPDSIEGHGLLAAMRGLLPEDVAVLAAERVPDAFHARFDAKIRSYRYEVSTVFHPLMRRSCWFVANNLDKQLLEVCAGQVLGVHDFRNFSKLDDESGGSVCEITHSAWTHDGDRLCYRIEGNRFMRHMVRRLVGTMVRVAVGKVEPGLFPTLLDGEQMRQKGFSAPAGGLTLEEVRY